MKHTTIKTTLAAGSTGTPYYYEVEISEHLCCKTCAANTHAFAPVFSLVSYRQVGTGQYEAIVSVSGVVTYTPCGKCTCASKTQLVNDTFVLPFYSVSAPASVAVSSGTTTNAVLVNGCASCGNTLQSVTPVSLSVTPNT